jgi:hypothetical protein
MTTPQYPHGAKAFFDFMLATPGTPYVYSGCLQTLDGTCLANVGQPCYQSIENPKQCALDPCYAYLPTEKPDEKYHCVMDSTTQQWVRGPSAHLEYFYPFKPKYDGALYISGM